MFVCLHAADVAYRVMRRRKKNGPRAIFCGNWSLYIYIDKKEKKKEVWLLGANCVRTSSCSASGGWVIYLWWTTLTVDKCETGRGARQMCLCLFAFESNQLPGSTHSGLRGWPHVLLAKHSCSSLLPEWPSNRGCLQRALDSAHVWSASSEAACREPGLNPPVVSTFLS